MLSITLDYLYNGKTEQHSVLYQSNIPTTFWTVRPVRYVYKFFASQQHIAMEFVALMDKVLQWAKSSKQPAEVITTSARIWVEGDEVTVYTR